MTQNISILFLLQIKCCARIFPELFEHPTQGIRFYIAKLFLRGPFGLFMMGDTMTPRLLNPMVVPRILPSTCSGRSQQFKSLPISYNFFLAFIQLKMINQGNKGKYENILHGPKYSAEDGTTVLSTDYVPKFLLLSPIQPIKGIIFQLECVLVSRQYFRRGIFAFISDTK